MPPALELRNIVKRFPGVVANDHIDLAVDRGEIRALLGENGAGKTTLMNILYGLEPPDEGEIHIRGQRHEFRSPLDAIRCGLGMVHQHFMLFPSLTVTENVIYGAEPNRRGWIDRQVAEDRLEDLAQRFGLRIDPRARVSSLSVGVRQRIEILKMLYRGADILILDEPTAVLTPAETDGLFSVLRSLAADGKTVIFISHKLPEILSLTDTITVLRDGAVTGHVRTHETSAEELCRLMVGREVVLEIDKVPAPEASPFVLAIADLRTASDSARPMVRGIDLELRAGEIVGVAGAAGNGQTELVEAITGLRPIASGTISLQAAVISGLPIGERRQAGLSHIPEDRDGDGLALEASLSDNLLMGFEAREPYAQRGVLRAAPVAEHAREILDNQAIRARSLGDAAGTLSGGNRQKLVVGRELAHQTRLLIANQPTRGVDIAATEQIYRALIDYRDAGNAVLLVSTDLSEILALSDRILVMFEGRIAGEVPGESATEQSLGMLMAGGIRD